MSVTIRVLAPAVTGEQRCHFLVQWRDSHAIQHGRTFATFDEAAVFDADRPGGRSDRRRLPGRALPPGSGPRLRGRQRRQSATG